MSLSVSIKLLAALAIFGLAVSKSTAFKNLLGGASNNRSITAPRIEQGTVLRVLTDQEYHYLQIDHDGHKFWLGVASSLTPPEIDDQVEFSVQTAIEAYESKDLRRAFEAVSFAAHFSTLTGEHS